MKQDSNSSSPATCIVDVEFGDESTDTFSYPHNDVEKLDLPLDSPEFFPDFFVLVILLMRNLRMETIDIQVLGIAAKLPMSAMMATHVMSCIMIIM